MAVCTSLITIWDIHQPNAPIHELIIPVETPRIQTGFWGTDGVSVIAPDTAGGVYLFKVSQSPECRILAQFFETDFTVSAWVPDHGQIEESNGQPIHKQGRSVLLNSAHIQVSQDFRPYSLDELIMIPLVTPELKYAWLNEELWVRKLGKEAESRMEIGTRSGEDLVDEEVDLGSEGEDELSEQLREGGRVESSEHSNSDGDGMEN
jgi:hypothetical protein